MAASGSDLRVAVVPEVNYGVTPATPSFATLRTTDGGLRTNKAVQASEERQFHQNLIDELQVAQDVEGSYSFEMSHASFDTLIEAVMGGTWTTNVIRNGITQRSFTFEEFLELGATDSFRRFTGCMVNTMALTVTAREKITGTFGIVGRQEVLATAAIAGATYSTPNAEVIMTGSGSVGTITVGALSGLRIRSLSLEINRNLRRVNAVGSIHTDLMNNGQCSITGSVEVYFESNAAYQAALNHETAAISVTIGHDANKRYTFAIPRARLGNAQVQAGGNTTDIMATLPFAATLVTSPENHSLQITRLVA
jgi:hypothetical protein